MPHLFLQRKRLTNFIAGVEDIDQHFQWEKFGAVAYVIGGIIFIAGSVYFLPKYEEHEFQGAVLFIVGSLLYGVVSCHDLAEVINYHKNKPNESKGANHKYMDLTAV